MKVFKFKFSRLTSACIYLGLVLAAAAFAVNTYLVFADGIQSAANAFYPVLQYTLMYFVCVLLAVVLVSLLVSSYYAVDGGTLKTSFGIIKSKYDIEKIESVILDRTTNKLSVYFEDQTFIVIVVNSDWYGDFTDALIKANEKISFSIKSKESDGTDSPKGH